MSDRRLAELKLAAAPGATTYDGIDPNGRCLSCGQQPCECEIGMLREACREIDRLRADGATLTTKVDALHDALTTLAGEYETAMRTLRTAEQRADEALAAHSASFGALSTLSAALFDGEVDDYAVLAEKIIARVRQLEADGATLREQVRKLPSPWTFRRELLGYSAFYYVGRCAWCGAETEATIVAPTPEPTHPDNGCLWSDVHQPASASNEPTP